MSLIRKLLFNWNKKSRNKLLMLSLKEELINKHFSLRSQNHCKKGIFIYKQTLLKQKNVNLLHNSFLYQKDNIANTNKKICYRRISIN